MSAREDAFQEAKECFKDFEYIQRYAFDEIWKVLNQYDLPSSFRDRLHQVMAKADEDLDLAFVDSLGRLGLLETREEKQEAGKLLMVVKRGGDEVLRIVLAVRGWFQRQEGLGPREKDEETRSKMDDDEKSFWDRLADVFDRARREIQDQIHRSLSFISETLAPGAAGRRAEEMGGALAPVPGEDSGPARVDQGPARVDQAPEVSESPIDSDTQAALDAFFPGYRGRSWPSADNAGEDQRSGATFRP